MLRLISHLKPATCFFNSEERDLNPSSGSRYQLLDGGEVVITDYNSTKAFSSFFPGVAGKNGIPLWTFYVNRGQCICSMGVEGKHHPIMEFLPANWACNLVSTQGFRTFIKLSGQGGTVLYEPFQNDPRQPEKAKVQRLIITPADLTLEEENQALGLKFTVNYFNIPQDEYAGLARRFSIQNLGSSPVTLQVLDGLPLIVPYGLDDYGLKHMRRLFEAFVEVINVENRIPFFKLKVEPADRPDVVRIKKGNFYLGFGEDHQLIDPIYDPSKIFGIRGDYLYPEGFAAAGPEGLASGQIFENRLPCAMGSFETSIATNRTYTYTSVIGHAGSVSMLNELVPKLIRPGYIEQKAIENHQIVSELSQRSFLCSTETSLDHYARQTFLDNVLRGGSPETIRGRETSTTLHLYSRKHGDLERDYNDFRLTPTPWSQGNGNFRDVNQNRRCDLFYNPEVGADNVKQFADLIQLDGFNPLVVKETRFQIQHLDQVSGILDQHLPEHSSLVAEFLRETYTPGELILFLRERGIELRDAPEHLIGDLLGISAKIYGTEPAEGFWTDHWTYNLDLLENYLSVYPEQERHILLEDKSFTFYDNPLQVQPRDEKYMIWEGRPMQLDAVVRDPEKECLISRRGQDPTRVRSKYGEGGVYTTTLAVKMLSLVANKLSSLDPEGVGVEMEAGKPNWYDALNGLPGLIGSSLCETLELKRHILFLREVIARQGDLEGQLFVYEELMEFLCSLETLLDASLSPFDFWDAATRAREKYRAQTRLGVCGQEKPLTLGRICQFLSAALAKLEAGLSKAVANESGMVFSYFINEATSYEELHYSEGDQSGMVKTSSRGLPCFRAKGFRQLPLPLFLEGQVHLLRSLADHKTARRLADGVKNSPLYDRKLGMYKVTESLDSQAPEIGRARTFSPGWFENESVWLHMEYKYMLELLRKGLHTEFFADFKRVFVPFLKPEVYGRSILENSSFIVSSANPDPSLHGNGFMARLSGATAEFVSILNLMTVGERPFQQDQDSLLRLGFLPSLPAWLFTREPVTRKLLFDGRWEDVSFGSDTLSFMFLGRILVTYHNPRRGDTFGPDRVAPVSWKLTGRDGTTQITHSGFITGETAARVRALQFTRIEIELG